MPFFFGIEQKLFLTHNLIFVDLHAFLSKKSSQNFFCLGKKGRCIHFMTRKKNLFQCSAQKRKTCFMLPLDIFSVIETKFSGIHFKIILIDNEMWNKFEQKCIYLKIKDKESVQNIWNLDFLITIRYVKIYC